MRTMTTAEFLETARKLRQQADRAEEAFLSFLYEGEGHPEIWQGTGHTYEAFIEGHDLCKAVRYLKYKKIREQHGVEAVQGVGIHAVVAAARFDDPAQQEEVLSESRVFEATNGTSISEQTAKAIARDVNTRTACEKAKHATYAQLLAQVERLNGLLVEERQKNAVLREEIKRLKSALRGSARARPAASPDPS